MEFIKNFVEIICNLQDFDWDKEFEDDDIVVSAHAAAECEPAAAVTVVIPRKKAI